MVNCIESLMKLMYSSKGTYLPCACDIDEWIQEDRKREACIQNFHAVKTERKEKKDTVNKFEEEGSYLVMNELK